MKKCPYCAEEIQDEAIKCKHCQSSINIEKKADITYVVEKKENSILTTESNDSNSVKNESEKQPKESKTKWGWILGILSVVVILAIRLAAMSGTHSVVSNSINSAPLSISELNKLSDDINKDLPKSIDEMTLLTKTFISNGNFIYSYKLLTREDEKYTQADLDKALKPVAIGKVCSTKTTKNILNSGTEIVFEYYDNNDTYIGKIPMKASDCK